MPRPPRAAGWIAASQKRADAGYDDWPRCRTCGQPMVLGQEISNRGRHYVCSSATDSGGNAKSSPAGDRPATTHSAKGQER